MKNLLKGFGKIMIIALGIFIGVILLFTSCTAAFVSSADEVIKEEEKKTETLKENTVITITDAKMGEYWFEIYGTVENKNDVELDYVEIEYTCYDAEGTQIDSSFTNMTNVPAGATVKWNAQCLEDGTTSAKVYSYDVSSYGE